MINKIFLRALKLDDTMKQDDKFSYTDITALN